MLIKDYLFWQIMSDFNYDKAKLALQNINIKQIEENDKKIYTLDSKEVNEVDTDLTLGEGVCINHYNLTLYLMSEVQRLNKELEECKRKLNQIYVE